MDQVSPPEYAIFGMVWYCVVWFTLWYRRWLCDVRYVVRRLGVPQSCPGRGLDYIYWCTGHTPVTLTQPCRLFLLCTLWDSFCVHQCPSHRDYMWSRQHCQTIGLHTGVRPGDTAAPFVIPHVQYSPHPWPLLSALNCCNLRLYYMHQYSWNIICVRTTKREAAHMYMYNHKRYNSFAGTISFKTELFWIFFTMEIWLSDVWDNTRSIISNDLSWPGTAGTLQYYY